MSTISRRAANWGRPSTMVITLLRLADVHLAQPVKALLKTFDALAHPADLVGSVAAGAGNVLAVWRGDADVAAVRRDMQARDDVERRGAIGHPLPPKIEGRGEAQ
jgi:hypothetical protein